MNFVTSAFDGTVNGTSTFHAAASQPTSYLERLWISTFENSRHPAVKLAVVLFVWQELVFFGRFLPYYIADQIPYFRRWKIQEEKPNTPELYWKCVKSVIISQFLVQLPLVLAFHPTAEFLGMKFLEVPFPSWATIGWSCLFCLFVEDTYHYFSHRLMHYGPFYKHIHKMHHEFSAPFGIAAEYAHPIEVLVVGQGFFLGPLLLLLMGVDVHIVTMMAWLAVRLIETVDVHSGYDFPWSLHKFIPFWGGADFHDYHHEAFVGNYSSSFRHWDWIFGTDAAYQKRRNAQAKKVKRAIAAVAAKKAK